MGHLQAKIACMQIVRIGHSVQLLAIFTCVLVGARRKNDGVSDKVRFGHAVQRFLDLGTNNVDCLDGFGVDNGSSCVEHSGVALVGAGQGHLLVERLTLRDVHAEYSCLGGLNGASNHRFLCHSVCLLFLFDF